MLVYREIGGRRRSRARCRAFGSSIDQSQSFVTTAPAGKCLRQSIAAPVLLVVASAATTLASAADSYPSRAVRMVVPFAEGATSGLVSRRPARGEDVGAAGV